MANKTAERTTVLSWTRHHFVSRGGCNTTTETSHDSIAWTTATRNVKKCKNILYIQGFILKYYVRSRWMSKLIIIFQQSECQSSQVFEPGTLAVRGNALTTVIFRRYRGWQYLLTCRYHRIRQFDSILPMHN